MHIAFNLNVQAKDGTLVLTDRTGKTVTFSEEHTVQQKVTMITLGELCGLPKHQLATCFGFKTDLNREEIAEALTQRGFNISARLVGQVLTDYGLSKKTADTRAASGAAPRQR